MFTLRTKLFSLYGGLFLLLIAAVVVTLYSNQRHETIVRDILAYNFDSAHFCRRAQKGLNELNTYAVASDRLDAPLTVPVDQLDVEIQKQLRAQINVAYPSDAAASGAILADYLQWIVDYRQFARIPSQQDRQKIYTATISPRLQSLLDRLDLIVAHDISAIQTSARESQRIAVVSFYITETLLVVAILFGGICLFAMERWIARPVAALTRSAQAIQAGNLDSPIHLPGTDEIGQLGRSFNAMAATLQQFRTSDHEKLLRTQQTTRAAINALPHAVAVLSPDGRIELANQPAETLFQITPGKTIGELPYPWIATLVNEAARTLHRVDPRGFQDAIQIFDKTHELFFLPHAIPLVDAGHKLVGITIVLVDATQLRQIDEAKSNLLSTVSHELKTPLTSIQMSIHLLLDDAAPRLTPKHIELLEAARDDADRLHQLIGTLLDKGRQQLNE